MSIATISSGSQASAFLEAPEAAPSDRPARYTRKPESKDRGQFSQSASFARRYRLQILRDVIRAVQMDSIQGQVQVMGGNQVTASCAAEALASMLTCAQVKPQLLSQDPFGLSIPDKCSGKGNHQDESQSNPTAADGEDGNEGDGDNGDGDGDFGEGEEELSSEDGGGHDKNVNSNNGEKVPEGGAGEGEENGKDEEGEEEEAKDDDNDDDDDDNDNDDDGGEDEEEVVEEEEDQEDEEEDEEEEALQPPKKRKK